MEQNEKVLHVPANGHVQYTIIIILKINQPSEMTHFRKRGFKRSSYLKLGHSRLVMAYVR